MGIEVKTTTVRILVDMSHEGIAYRGNQLVVFSEADAAMFVKVGVADDSQAVVDYCQTHLGVIPVVHADLVSALAMAGVQ